MGYSHKAIILVLLLLDINLVGASCTYRKNAFGISEYKCENGMQGRLEINAFGMVRDTRTGIRYGNNAFGNIQGSDGSHWYKNAFGNWQSDEGIYCRKNAFGYLVCE